MNRLEQLLQSRSQAAEVPFALTVLDKRTEYYGDPKVMEFYTKSFSRDKHYVTTRQERKQLIANGTHYLYAGAELRLVRFADGVTRLITTYRDKHAPSWPDTLNLPAGLSRLINGEQEKIDATCKREADEEIVFVDNNKQEVMPSLRNLTPNNKRVKIYFEDKSIDSVNVWSIGEGVEKIEPGWSFVKLGLYDINCKQNEISVVNGEAIPSRTIVRDAYLLLLEDVFGEGKIETTIYSASLESDEIKTERRVLHYREMQKTTTLRSALDRMLETGKKDFMKMLE